MHTIPVRLDYGTFILSYLIVISIKYRFLWQISYISSPVGMLFCFFSVSVLAFSSFAHRSIFSVAQFCPPVGEENRFISSKTCRDRYLKPVWAATNEAASSNFSLLLHIFLHGCRFNVSIEFQPLMEWWWIGGSIRKFWQSSTLLCYRVSP